MTNEPSRPKTKKNPTAGSGPIIQKIPPVRMKSAMPKDSGLLRTGLHPQ